VTRVEAPQSSFPKYHELFFIFGFKPKIKNFYLLAIERVPVKWFIEEVPGSTSKTLHELHRD
jgi:hypothetical protein